ncbi:MAG: GreA/GreB family elongation factor [Phycisphaerae bacterium]
MIASKMLQLVRDGDLDGFENLCLEMLAEGNLQLAELVAPFEELERLSRADHAATLGEMVLESADVLDDPSAALKIARVALLGDPNNDELRQRAVALYRQVHGDRPGFDALLEICGLAAGRAARNAIRLIDMCLSLQPGDALISRVEDVVVEVLDVDFEHGLVTLRQHGRPKTITPLELSREYERATPDDFRVMRALEPDRLAELLESDPVAVVIDLIHAHGEAISRDVLKRELVPKHLSAKEWSKWWAKARAALQQSPHVIIEGRAPVLLRYTSRAWTLEDATWERFAQQSGPDEWLATLESYLREKRRHQEKPDVGLLARCQARLDRHRMSIEDKRPSEALACALVSERIGEVADGLDDEARELGVALLRGSDDPATLIAGLESETLWARALTALATARPHDAAARAVELVPVAPAMLLDRIIALARAADLLELVQTHIDTALADPVDYPELIYWLWKGSKEATGLRLPADDALFTTLVQTLSALGRTLNPGSDVTRRFRQRVRAALSLRDYARVRECIPRIGAERAVTLRSQLLRLEGIGDNARLRLLELLRAVHPALWVAPQRRLQPWEDPDVLWNTAAGLQRKTEQRDHLVNVTMHENAKRIGEAASHGDLSENSEYKFALEERDFLRARLAQMNSDLALADTIRSHQVPTDRVGVGSRVRLRDLADGACRVMTFLGPFDTDVDRGIYNYQAPVGLQLMGSRVGERRTLNLDGREREFEVVEIASGLPADEVDT